jgi:CDP-glycerol glycerophosphotransferase (TagB/SpsB family)
MPTFRDDRTRAFPYPWRTLDDICARTKTSVLVRLHPVDRSNSATGEIAQLEHLRMHDSKEDPALLFQHIDGLITDYSSVVYDFMLLQKPVIFFCQDLAQFIENSRDLYFDLQDVTPGPVAEDLAQLEAALDDLSSGALDRMPFEDKYQKTLGLFHKYKDGKSSQRVWSEIRRRFCPSTLDDAS